MEQWYSNAGEERDALPGEIDFGVQDLHGKLQCEQVGSKLDTLPPSKDFSSVDGATV